MNDKLQNLLTETDKQIIVSSYRKRFFIVVSWVIFFAFTISSIALLPVFFLTQSKIDTTVLKLKISSIEEGERAILLNMPDRINSFVRTVISFKSPEKVSNKIQAIQSAASIPGVSVNVISYNPKDQNNKLGMSVSGFAKDRTSLLSFQNEIQKLSFVTDTSIPIGDFTKDSNLNFTISVSIKLQ